MKTVKVKQIKYVETEIEIQLPFYYKVDISDSEHYEQYAYGKITESECIEISFKFDNLVITREVFAFDTVFRHYYYDHLRIDQDRFEKALNKANQYLNNIHA